MDNSIIADNIKPIVKHYPDMYITQLGMVCLMLGALRSTMGHEDARSTIESYIHHKHLDAGVYRCLDFLEREVLAMKRSKLDIDIWKRGNRALVWGQLGLGSPRRPLTIQAFSWKLPVARFHLLGYRTK